VLLVLAQVEMLNSEAPIAPSRRFHVCFGMLGSLFLFCVVCFQDFLVFVACGFVLARLVRLDGGR
jgi:hypothetical protein